MRGGGAEDEIGQRRLIAYVVLKPGQDQALVNCTVPQTQAAGLHGALGVETTGLLPHTPSGRLTDVRLPAAKLSHGPMRRSCTLDGDLRCN
jgi:hypothetical protein